MKKKLIVITVAVAALVIIGVCLTFALCYQNDTSYAGLLAQGERYLKAGNYDQAVLVLKQAIVKEPKNAEAYICLSRAYVQMGMPDVAVIVLSDGYTLTSNLTISRMILELEPQYFEENASQSAQAAATERENSETTERQERYRLYTDFLQYASSASFEDYRVKYGSVSCTPNNGVYVVRLSGLDAELRYFDTDTMRVIDANAGRPYDEFVPNEIVLDDIMILFGDAQTITYEDLQSMSGLSKLKYSGNTISFEAGNCSVSITCDDSGVFGRGAAHLIVPLGTSAAARSFEIRGRVTSASDGGYVSYARMKFYKGSSASGSVLADVTTNSSGEYSINVDESGTYCVSITKDGFITESFEIYVAKGDRTTYGNFIISPQVAYGQIRLVLTWGGEFSDLDSYLSGTTDSGQSINISYHNKTAVDSNGNVLATLDVDHTSGYGPETTTLNAVNGTYQFYVRDYHKNGNISASGAQVKVYIGDALVHVIDICAGLENVWTVCYIDHGTVSVING